MSAAEILQELESLGNEKTRKMLMKNHGVPEPCFGVKVGDMKPIQKRIKNDYHLALDLFETGNYDARYLAGLIADDEQMTKKDLQRWAAEAHGGCLAGATVAWVAAGSRHGWEMALKWIDAKTDPVPEAGWATLSSLVALKEDDDLDLPVLKKLITRVKKDLPKAASAGTAYGMNGFLIAVGSYVKPLSALALKTAEAIGPVSLDLGNNACKVPFAADYIRKVERRGSIGKKRKTVKC